MLFNSIEFLIFFPIVILGCFIIPKRSQYIWLLMASYYFYLCWNVKYALLLLASTIITYAGGIGIEWARKEIKETKKRELCMRLCVLGSAVLNLAILGYFKYMDFFVSTIGKFFHMVNVELIVPNFDIVLPVGISFYTFQALGYTIDVYRGEVDAERNVFRYALFVSFFPQLVAGPIERSKNLLKQLKQPLYFDAEKALEGFLLMLWGFFMKIVVADRIALMVDTVYANSEAYGGVYLIIASILFAFQIYCDFGGYSCIAIGAAEILGIELMENFNAPYLSKTIKEFWGRWHISLSGWFKDYLYIPLGGNRKGRVRKYINVIAVFLVSGLWHGAAWAFVIWGGLHGLYQIMGEVLMPLRNRCANFLHINRDSLGYKSVQVLITFCLTDFAWVFFRAQTSLGAVNIIKSMWNVRNPWILLDGSLYNCGLDSKNFGLLIFSLLIVFVVDLCKNKNICIRKIVMKQDLWAKSLIIAVSIAFILLFGIWGSAFDEANFIYFQF